MAVPDPLLVGLGRALRAAREARGLSQERLEAASGVHRNYIGGIERAERQPTLATLAKLADALGIGLGELIAHAEQPQGVPDMVRSTGYAKRPGDAPGAPGPGHRKALPMPITQAIPQGNRVAEARGRVGLTQPELAARATVGRSTIARIEAGRQSPTIEVALALSRELGESVEALFGGDA
jgi:transcriptional regulator with XRE-family HTH domain